MKTESTKAIEKGQNYTEMEWSRCVLEMEEHFTEIIGTCKGGRFTIIEKKGQERAIGYLRVKQPSIINKQAKELSASTDKINSLELQISMP